MMVRHGTECAVKRTGRRLPVPTAVRGAGTWIDVDEAVGEGLDEGGLFGPLFDEGEVDGRRCGVAFEGGHEGAAVEADAGAGVLRGEADGDEAGDAVGAHLGDDVGDVGMPVAHAGVDAQRMCLLRRGPARGDGLA